MEDAAGEIEGEDDGLEGVVWDDVKRSATVEDNTRRIAAVVGADRAAIDGERCEIHAVLVIL